MLHSDLSDYIRKTKIEHKNNLKAKAEEKKK